MNDDDPFAYAFRAFMAAAAETGRRQRALEAEAKDRQRWVAPRTAP